MPRATLPGCLSGMETMNVLLTKTTEEQIKAHIEKVIVDWPERMYAYELALDRLTQTYHSDNPNPFDKYTVQDWRSGKVTMKYRFNGYAWMSEEDNADYDELMKIRRDLMKCLRAFPEWREQFSEIEYQMQRGVVNPEELIRLEKARYYESKERYAQADAQYIKDRQASLDHEYHYEHRETCERCVLRKQRMQEQKEYEEEERRKAEEDERRYRENQKQRRQAELETRKLNTCETCEYSTYGPDAFARHLESKEHKVAQNHKDWFCECCAFQGRSTNEYEFHLKSTKHKKNAGLLEVVTEYKCECCNYETKLKGNYDRHLLSKGHAAKQ